MLCCALSLNYSVLHVVNFYKLLYIVLFFRAAGGQNFIFFQARLPKFRPFPE